MVIVGYLTLLKGRDVVMSKKSDNGERIRVIREVKTPLGFFTLAILITEVILGGLATKANGFDFTLIIVGMLISYLSLIFIVAYLAFKKPQRLYREHEKKS